MERPPKKKLPVLSLMNSIHHYAPSRGLPLLPPYDNLSSLSIGSISSERHPLASPTEGSPTYHANFIDDSNLKYLPSMESPLPSVHGGINLPDPAAFRLDGVDHVSGYAGEHNPMNTAVEKHVDQSMQGLTVSGSLNDVDNH